MKFGIVMPPEDAQSIVNFAIAAEKAGWDGFFVSEGMWSVDAWVCPEDILPIKAWLEARRAETHPFDIVIEGQTPGSDLDKAHAILQPWQEAGATWWIESIWDDPAAREDRLRQGPCR